MNKEIKEITLSKKSFAVKKPASIATCFEFVIEWSSSESNVKNARLCAGAIGLYLDKLSILPKYKPMKETPLQYGYTCLDRIMSMGVAGSEVYSVGSSLLFDMASQLPTDQGVEDKKDFFPSTNSDDMNS